MRNSTLVIASLLASIASGISVAPKDDVTVLQAEKVEGDVKLEDYLDDFQTMEVSADGQGIMVDADAPLIQDADPETLAEIKADTFANAIVEEGIVPAEGQIDALPLDGDAEKDTSGDNLIADVVSFLQLTKDAEGALPAADAPKEKRVRHKLAHKSNGKVYLNKDVFMEQCSNFMVPSNRKGKDGKPLPNALTPEETVTLINLQLRQSGMDLTPEQRQQVEDLMLGKADTNKACEGAFERMTKSKRSPTGGNEEKERAFAKQLANGDFLPKYTPPTEAAIKPAAKA